MDPVKKFLYLQTGAGLALLGATFLASSRITPLLPGLSKKALLLTEGTLLSSSIAYNYFRDLNQTSHLEKMALFAAISFVATKWIPPKAAITAFSATFAFSAVTQLAAPTFTEKKHLYYTKKPEEWVALPNEKRSKLFLEFFNADLPPIPIYVRYGIDFPETLTDDITENPENYSENQLSSFTLYLRCNQGYPLSKKTFYFIKNLIDRGVPIFGLNHDVQDLSKYEETLYALYKKEPIHRYAFLNDLTELRSHHSLPSLKKLTKDLTPKTVQAMPPHLVFAWHCSFIKNDQKYWDSLDFLSRLAFCVRFSQHNLVASREIFNAPTIGQEIVKAPEKFNAEALAWSLQQSSNDRILLVTSKNIKCLKVAQERGVLLPYFQIIEEVAPNSETAKIAYALFLANPIYALREQNINVMQSIIQDQAPLPTLDALKQKLTPSSVKAMRPDYIQSWYKALGCKLEGLSYSIQIAFSQRLQELNIAPKVDDESLIEYVTAYPQDFSKEELSFILDQLSLIPDQKGPQYTKEDLFFLETAMKKGVELPPLTINLGEDATEKDRTRLAAIYKKYPIYRCLCATPDSDDQIFSSLAKKLIPTSVRSMSLFQLQGWLQAFKIEDARWKKISPKVIIAFFQMFDAHGLDYVYTKPLKAQLQSLETNDDQLTKDEAQWYLKNLPDEPLLTNKDVFLKKIKCCGMQLPLFAIKKNLQENHTGVVTQDAINALSFRETTHLYDYLKENPEIWNKVEPEMQACMLIKFTKCSVDIDQIELSLEKLITEFVKPKPTLSQQAKQWCVQYLKAWAAPDKIVKIDSQHNWNLLYATYTNNIRPPLFVMVELFSREEDGNQATYKQMLETIYKKNIPHYCLNKIDVPQTTFPKDTQGADRVKKMSDEDVVLWHTLFKMRKNAKSDSTSQRFFIERFIALDLKYFDHFIKPADEKITLSYTEEMVSGFSKNQRKWYDNATNPPNYSGGLFD